MEPEKHGQCSNRRKRANHELIPFSKIFLPISISSSLFSIDGDMLPFSKSFPNYLLLTGCLAAIALVTSVPLLNLTWHHELMRRLRGLQDSDTMMGSRGAGQQRGLFARRGSRRSRSRPHSHSSRASPFRGDGFELDSVAP